MNHPAKVEDLTEEEIRHLLSLKLRSTNPKRLERFRRSGRLVELIPDSYPVPLEAFSTRQIENDAGSIRERQLWTMKRSVSVVLTLLEVFAFLTFLYFMIKGVGLHHLLNRTVSIALKLPAITPTPLISAIVLPTGHVHPNPYGDSRQNGAEIPRNLNPLVQQPTINLPIPTPAPQHGIRIQIPALNVDAPIVHGDDWEQLKKGVAHHDGSANPGQAGNIVLSGHNDTYGEVFRYLEELKPGDKIIIYTSQRAYTYIISGWQLVEPTQVEVMAPTPTATITLISCHPYLVDNHRIVVKGNLVG